MEPSRWLIVPASSTNTKVNRPTRTRNLTHPNSLIGAPLYKVRVLDSYLGVIDASPEGIGGSIEALKNSFREMVRSSGSSGFGFRLLSDQVKGAQEGKCYSGKETW